jgi:hypothetical protein
MKTNVYSLYDSVAAVFGKPFFCQNHEIAIRAVRNSYISHDNQILDASVKDQTLYQLGVFDDITGSIQPAVEPKKVRTGFDLYNEAISKATNKKGN